MSDFYIVPPRLIVGSLQRSNTVTSLNTLKGDLSFKISPDTGLTLNINSGIFNLSIQPDFYIKKSGDTIPSNIIFQPDPGKYGLAVGSGTADPGIGVSGALFFNTSYNVLKVYDGSTWNEIASTGTSGITQSFADTRYLRLDGGNTPSGAISMGSQFLRFANLTTRSAAGTAGQAYFNTDTNKLDLYNGSSWVAVGSGITQITAGNGISLSNAPISTYGAVSVNENYNFNWTGTNTYTQPITFSASQTFDASKLTIAYEVAGDILKFDGLNWVRMPKGSPHQILSVACCSDDLEYISLVGGSGIAISFIGGQATFSSTGATSTLNIVAGKSGFDFNVVGSGNTYTINIPNAGVGFTGLVTGLGQTFGGIKTFADGIISAAGATIYDTLSLPDSPLSSLYGGTGYTNYAKGDLLVGSGNTLSKFPVGTDTYVLTADSSASTGITWKAASGGSGTTTIGIPTDGVYTDGFFSTWADNTTIANAFDDVNELLALIAPAKPGTLSGTTLTATSTPTYYTAKIAAGLGTEWYQAGYGTGDSIPARYFVTGAHTLTTASTTTRFYAGTLVTSTYGVLKFNIANYLASSGATYGQIDMTTSYAVNTTNNNLVLTALDVYNSIWTKANARISAYTPSHSGYQGLSIAHTTEAQTTDSYNIWYDAWSSGKSPSFSQSATASTYSQSLKWLSGIGYYTTGTGFSVYFKGAAGIYSSCYNVTQTYAISATGLITATGLPASPPLYTDELDKSGSNHVRVTLNSASAFSFNKYLTVTLYKAHNTTAAQNPTILRAINTYGTTSTDTFEGFQDEARRLVIGSGIAFTSTLEMASGNAQVRSGTLQYPLAADYDTEWGGTHTFSGDQEYQRYFYKTSASTGTLTFGGFTASNVAPYGTGNINVLLYLDGDALFFDLGVLQGSNSNNGSTRALAISAKTSASGGALGWSIGVKTTGVSGAGNSARYRAIVIFRNNTYSTTSITSS